MTGDPERIDDVLSRVDRLVVPIQEVTFDPFGMQQRSGWIAIVQDFNTKVTVSVV